MERNQTFRFTEEELDTLESALALYAGYTREMQVDMLIGGEANRGEIIANHNRARRLHRQLFNLTEDHDYEEERAKFAEIRGRPMDVNDFSPFDWYEFVNGE